MLIDSIAICLFIGGVSLAMWITRPATWPLLHYAHHNDAHFRKRLTQDLQRARKNVSIVTAMHANHWRSNQVVNALAEAAARGVKITVIVHTQQQLHASIQPLTSRGAIDVYRTNKSIHTELRLVDNNGSFVGQADSAKPYCLWAWNYKRIAAKQAERIQKYLDNAIAIKA